MSLAHVFELCVKRFMVGYTPMKGVPILIIEEAEVWIENAKQVEKNGN